MSSALFEYTPHGWMCKKYWHYVSGFNPPLCVPFTKSIFMNVRKKPKMGFCKRPHFYL